jgi:hypothetical protein
VIKSYLVFLIPQNLRDAHIRKTPPLGKGIFWFFSGDGFFLIVEFRFLGPITEVWSTWASGKVFIKSPTSVAPL